MPCGARALSGVSLAVAAAIREGRPTPAKRASQQRQEFKALAGALDGLPLVPAAVAEAAAKAEEKAQPPKPKRPRGRPGEGLEPQAPNPEAEAGFQALAGPGGLEDKAPVKPKRARAVPFNVEWRRPPAEKVDPPSFRTGPWKDEPLDEGPGGKKSAL